MILNSGNGGAKIIHAETHAQNGSDPVLPVNIGAAEEKHSHNEFYNVFYTKEQALKGETAETFGLLQSATPADIFENLAARLFGSDVMYQWARTKQGYVATQATSRTTLWYASGSGSNYSAYSLKIEYSGSYLVGDDGTITLVDPSTTTVSFNSNTSNDTFASKASTLNSLLSGKYVKMYEGSYEKACGKFDAVSAGNSGGWYFYLYGYKLTADEGTLVEHLQSMDSSTYPDSGTDSDGWSYSVLSPVVAKFSMVEVGSFVGTGGNGEANSNSLSFSFKPKIVIVSSHANTAVNDDKHVILWAFPIALTNGYTKHAYNGIYGSSVISSTYCYAKWDDNTNELSWYNTNDAIKQANTSGEFCYVAIG